MTVRVHLHRHDVGTVPLTVQIALVASRLRQFWKILKTLMQLILNSTWPHVITYTNRAGDNGLRSRILLQF